MICNKCGNQINENDKFCGSCGNTIEIMNINPQATLNQNINMNVNSVPENQLNNFVNNINHEYNNQTNNNFTKPKTGLKTASKVIGIVSIISVFIIQIFSMPISLVGLILGIIYSKKNKKVCSGLILNAIAFVIAIPILLIYGKLFGLDQKPVDNVIGTWNCKAFNNGYYEDLDYVVTFKVNKDNQFLWSKYNDEQNNYVYGNYEFKDLEKKNNNGTFSYYSLTLNGEEYINNGQLQTEEYKSKYEMGVSKNRDENDNEPDAILMNETTYNMYACFLVDDSSSKIEKNYSENYNTNENNNIRMNKLTFSLPAGLTEGGMNTEDYKSFNYMTSDSYCKFKVNIYNSYYEPITTQKYFEDYVYDEDKDLTKIYSKTLNGSEWSMLDVDGEYSYNKYGVYIDDKTAYGIEFSITEEKNNECTNLYNKIIESIKIN